MGEKVCSKNIHVKEMKEFPEEFQVSHFNYCIPDMFMFLRWRYKVCAYFTSMRGVCYKNLDDLR